MDYIFAYYCAPALAGIKSANIVSCDKLKIRDAEEKIARLNLQLNKKDIFFEILWRCSKSILVMVYRKRVLEKKLGEEKIYRFLRTFGYPERVTSEGYIEFLKSRMKNQEFPHEIGAFLGYPLHDIQGFLYHKDFGCILCGEWKVYKDAERAEKLFDRFAACRRAVTDRVMRGYTLAQIFCAV